MKKFIVVVFASLCGIAFAGAVEMEKTASACYCTTTCSPCAGIANCTPTCTTYCTGCN